MQPSVVFEHFERGSEQLRLAGLVAGLERALSEPVEAGPAAVVLRQSGIVRKSLRAAVSKMWCTSAGL
jgi:hypothetical protein